MDFLRKCFHLFPGIKLNIYWVRTKRRVGNRAVTDGIFLVFRTGCEWNALNTTGISSSSSACRRFQEWRDTAFLSASGRMSYLPASTLMVGGRENLSFVWTRAMKLNGYIITWKINIMYRIYNLVRRSSMPVKRQILKHSGGLSREHIAG